MLTKESFIKGIKDLRAVFGINPDKETLEIWFRHLNKLEDKYFLAGVSLMAENEAEFYPNTNIVLKIKTYADMARNKEQQVLDKLQWEKENTEYISAIEDFYRRSEAKKIEARSSPRLLKYLGYNPPKDLN